MGSSPSAPLYSAAVPHGKRPGEQITQSINGKTYLVQIPGGVSAGNIFRFRLQDCQVVDDPKQQPTHQQNQHNIAYNNTNQLPAVSAPGHTSPMVKYQVTIPANVFPGQAFQVNINGDPMTVKCPMDGLPGKIITIDAPAPNTAAPSTALVANAAATGSGASISATGYASAPPASAPAQTAPPTRLQVTIPPGIYPNQQFSVMANNQVLMITAPSGSHPGQSIVVEVPAAPMGAAAPYHNPSGAYGNTASLGPNGGTPSTAASNSPSPYGAPGGGQSIVPFGLTNPPAMNVSTPSQPETYKVTIPMDVRAGQNFEATVGGQKITLKCPPNAHSGMVITLQGPSAPPAQQQQQQQYQRTEFGALPVASAVSAPPMAQTAQYQHPPPQQYQQQQIPAQNPYAQQQNSSSFTNPTNPSAGPYSAPSATAPPPSQPQYQTYGGSQPFGAANNNNNNNNSASFYNGTAGIGGGGGGGGFSNPTAPNAYAPALHKQF